MQFVAIDFETANEKRCSPCAIGISWIVGNSIRTESRLIRPKEMRFSPLNFAIHGISPDMVRKEPEFPEIWEKLFKKVDEVFFLAHNASFDMSVLRATFDLYNMPWPTATYLCTVKVAKAIWPDLADHRLPTVCNHLGIDLNHHDAGSDAFACAQIALRASKEKKCQCLTRLAGSINLENGFIKPDSYLPCRTLPWRHQQIRTMVKQVENGPVAGKRFVFTGALTNFNRDSAGELVKFLGGIYQHSGVRRDTDYLVVGDAPGGIKMAKAIRLSDATGRPRIIDENTFLEMVGWI